MSQCVSSSYLVARQRQQVYSSSCRAPAEHCDMHVSLPIFSQMCLRLLLEGATITLGGAPLIYQQYRRTMSNTPFHGLIWIHT